jgi:hypothetical protein
LPEKPGDQANDEHRRVERERDPEHPLLCFGFND